jgi:Flp pilus assembly protein TadG
MAMTVLRILRKALSENPAGQHGCAVVKHCLRDRSGASAILLGIALPVLVGFVGLGVETGIWYLEKRELQEAADSAALAGAREFAANAATQTAMETAATSAVSKSGFSGVTPVINQPPASGLFATGGTYADPNAVEAIVTQTYSTYFVSLFGLNSVDITTRAVAVEGGGNSQMSACIVALAEGYPNEPEICGNNATGVVFQGSLDLNLSSCTVHSNDSCGPSYDFNGNPTISVDCLTYSGGSEVGVDPVSGDSSNLTLTNCDEPTYAGVVGNPYADVFVPASLGPCHAAPDGVPDPSDPTNTDKRVFTPGYYCDTNPSPNAGGIELLSTTGQSNTLEPGVYFVDGSVHINGASLYGENVIIVMVDTVEGTFDFNGNGALTLIGPTYEDIFNAPSPAFDLILDQGVDPTSHNWAGLSLYLTMTSDLGDSNPCSNKINGTAYMEVSGAVYAPNTCITFTGNNTSGSSDDSCFQLIAGNITLAGNVTMSSSNCQMGGGAGGNGSTYGTIVGLVE